MTEDELNEELAANDVVEGENVVEETETAVETPGVEVANAVVDEEEDDFFGDTDGFELPDPEHVITVLTSSGGRTYVPAQEAMSVNDVISLSGFNVMHGAEFYLNGSILPTDGMVPAGQTLQIVGTVKGG